MMEEILNSDAEKDKEILSIISSLKSMQMLTATVKGQSYYDEALKIVEKNSRRFEPFLSFTDKNVDYRILVRKKNNTIVEVVMLMHEKNHFSVINFTGKMSAAFIAKLSASMKQKRS